MNEGEGAWGVVPSIPGGKRGSAAACMSHGCTYLLGWVDELRSKFRTLFDDAVALTVPFYNSFFAALLWYYRHYAIAVEEEEEEGRKKEKGKGVRTFSLCVSVCVFYYFLFFFFLISCWFLC